MRAIGWLIAAALAATPLEAQPAATLASAIQAGQVGERYDVWGYPEGEVYFDVTNGRLRGVRYRCTADLAEHRGEGSKYQFQSVYNEDLVEVK